MTERYVLLDQQNGGLLVGQGTYQCMFSEPMTLPPKSQVVVDSAFIDARVSGQGAFEIVEDLLLEIDLAYSMYDFLPANATHIKQMSILMSGNNIARQTLQITIPAGVYGPTDLAAFISREAQRLSDDYQYEAAIPTATQQTWYKPPLFQSIGVSANPTFHSTSGDANAMISNNPNSLENVDYGTTQFALEWDGSIFSFTALHRPCFSGTGAPCAFLRRVDRLGGISIFEIVPYVSCVHLFDLRPANFWTSLGFDLSKVTISPNTFVDNTGLEQMSLETMLNTTTRAFVGISSLPLTTNADPNEVRPEHNWPNGDTYDTEILTNQVVTVDASGPPVFSTDGYFLLDVQLLPAASNMITSSLTSLNAMALVSRVITSDEGFAFNVSSLTLINDSTEQLVVGSANVTILSASTLQPFSGLGIRNSVILKVLIAND